MCDSITDDIYRKLERDRSIIYVCKLCRDEVEKIKKECRREVSTNGQADSAVCRYSCCKWIVTL